MTAEPMSLAEFTDFVRDAPLGVIATADADGRPEAALLSLGVKASQLSTISYGEEIPLDPGDAEDAYAKNRRAHFALYRKGEGQNTRGEERRY